MDRDKKVQYLKIHARVLEDGTWEIPSHSSNKKYNVTWNGVGGTCECLGYEYRRWCIHLDVVKAIAPGKSKEVPILDEMI